MGGRGELPTGEGWKGCAGTGEAVTLMVLSSERSSAHL